MAEEVDPFTQAGDAIFAALLAFEPFAGAFRPANIAQQDQKGVVRAGIARAPADFPFVTVAQAGFAMVPIGRNSKTADASQTYVVQISTNDQTTDDVNRLKWLAFIALVRAGNSFGLPFVRDWAVTSGTEGMANVTPTAGPTAATPPGKAWVALLYVSVEMYWDRAKLIA